MSERRWQLAITVAAAIVPVLLAALVGLAWANSHRLAVQTRDIEAMQAELTHLRELIEKPLR